jgi:hypothetical protein
MHMLKRLSGFLLAAALVVMPLQAMASTQTSANTTSGGTVKVPAVGNLFQPDGTFNANQFTISTAAPNDLINDRGRAVRYGSVTTSTTPARLVQPNKVTFNAEATNDTVTRSLAVETFLGDRVSVGTTGGGVTAGTVYHLGGIPFSSCNSSTNLCTTAFDPGWAANDEVLLYVFGGSLPTGVVGNTKYYLSDDTGTTTGFRATPSGATIDLTSAGSGTIIAFHRTIGRLHTTLATAQSATSAVDITGTISSVNMPILDVNASNQILIRNDDASIAVYIGFDANVSASSGLKIPAGTTLSVPVNVLGSIWVVAASGTPVVQYLVL